MGVDTRIYLPKDVRLQDVADVIGILSGLPKEKKKLRDDRGDDSWYVKVKGVSVEGLKNVPEAPMIYLKGKLADDSEGTSVMFHYEGGSERDYISIIPRSTPFWLAIGTHLCTFFGGKIDFQDCDETDWDIKYPRPRRDNSPSDGTFWQDFQQEKWNLTPITKADIKIITPHAAYK